MDHIFLTSPASIVTANGEGISATTQPGGEEDGDEQAMLFYALPPVSASRITREVNLEKIWSSNPYRTAKTSWFEDVHLKPTEVREKERMQIARRRPITSKSAKVRGTEGATSTTNSDNLDIDLTNAITPEEIKRSLVIIGNKSCSADPASVSFVDPELLLTKAPGFPVGVTLAQQQHAVQSAADAVLETERRKKREEEKKAAQALLEAELDKRAVEQEFMEANETALGTSSEGEQANEKPVRKPKSQQEDEYVKPSSKPWSVIDDSDVSDFHTQVPQLAIQYPFELDFFQKRAVKHLEKGESVFVAAHTSAGKTVVAEYAIALAFEHRTRLVYTSPIKALSNQKFRDFSEKFGSDKVGLLTGDNSVNPDAPCVIMTTEILRSMLYRGAEMIQDVEFVVFDEVHYISDPERGVIWEEVVIMLPLHVHVVMLSATTPNTEEFSAWVGRNRREQVFVVSTDKRPVPLEHFLYLDGEMFKIMDNTNRFTPEAHLAALNARKAKDPFNDRPDARKNKVGGATDQRFAEQKWQASSGGGSKNQRTGENRWLDLVKDLDRKKLLPVIIFTFSKAQVEVRASALSKIDLLSSKEKSQAHVIMHKALARLQEQDRNLPQIQRVAFYLSKGIGIHHGGLLPLLKEVVEICFTSGLVRVLIATETFAMGVNAPCRTVVFGSLRKHDGSEFRDLLPGEYIQMCGRAGRRGLDTVGTVIILCEDDVPPLESLTQMLSGKSSKLNSRFRLRYSMILNLLRQDNLSVSDMMKRSFSEFSRSNLHGTKATQIKSLRADLKQAKKECFDDFPCVRQHEGALVNDIEDYHIVLDDLTRSVYECLEEMLNEVHGKKAKEEVLRPGRVIQVSLDDLQLYSLNAVVIQEISTPSNKLAQPSSMLLRPQLMSKQSLGTSTSDERFVVLCLLPDDFEPPANAISLVSVAEAASLSTTKSMAPSSSALVGKRRKDDDDDDEFTVKGGKGKKKPLAGAPPVFFDRNAVSSTAATTSSALPSSASGGSDLVAAPRAQFGTFETSEDEEQDGKPHKRRMVLMRIALKEIERVSGVYLEQGIGRELSQKITLERSEKDANLVARTLFRKLASQPNPQRLRSIDLPRELKADGMQIVEKWKLAESRRENAEDASLCHSCVVKNEHRHRAKKVAQLQREIKLLQKDISNETLTLFPDFMARLEVLRQLKYVNRNESEIGGSGAGEEEVETATMELKGRVACEINTCDELLLAEMVFENVFEPLDPAEAVALLSCLVLQGKCEDVLDPPTESLALAVAITRDLATNLQNLQEDYAVRLDRGFAKEWVDAVFNPGLLAVVYEWARGRPFASLTSLTSLEEGTIVRCITRLDETCREVRNIARLVGDPSLLRKMEEASLAIKRDIVFATSLYVG